MKSDDLQLYYEFGPFRLEVARRQLLCGEEVVQLRPKTIETLLLLIEHRDRILSKEELLSQLWPNTVVEEANLTQYIYLLRKTLGKCVAENGQPHEYILTIPGRGYRFVVSVSEVQGKGADLVVEEQHQVPEVIEEKATAPPFAESVFERVPRNDPEARPQPTGLHSVSPADGAKRRLKPLGAAAILSILALTLAVVTYLVRGKTNSAATDAWSLTRLTNTGNVPLASISPDGNLINYVVADGGLQSLWIRQAATSNEVQIVPPAEVYYGGLTFTPDGRYIYYVVRGKESRLIPYCKFLR